MSSEQELLAQTEAVGQPGHHRLRLVAPVALELLLQIGEELDVLRRGVLGHRLACRAHRLVEHVEPAGREDVGEAGGLETEAAGHRSLGQEPEGAQQPDVATMTERGVGSPTMTEMKDDLPVPFRPTSPTFSPAPTTNEASETSVRSPISMVSDEPTITPQCTGVIRPSIHSADAEPRTQVVDPDRGLYRHLHAAARHHGRQRGPARHPALAAFDLSPTCNGSSTPTP